MKLKLIKSKAFEAKGEKHTHHTVAYKGRVFGISTMRFTPEDITVGDGVLTLNCDVEVLKNTSTDPIDGTIKVFLDIVPKLDILLASI
jgi:hypothetical protein